MPAKESTSVSTEETQSVFPKTANIQTRSGSPRLSIWLVVPLLAILVFALYGPTISYNITNWDDTWLLDNKWLSTFIANDVESSPTSADGTSISDVAAELEVKRQANTSQALAHIWNPWAAREIREDLGNEYLPLRDMSYILSFKLSPLFFPDQAANAPNMVRLMNILLHLGNVILVFLLIAALSRRRYLALVVAALFAVMPIHVESVVWLSSRKELLSAFFLLLSLYLYVKARSRFGEEEQAVDGAQGHSLCRLCFGLCVFFFVCALLSKTPALVLPGLVLIIELLRPKAFSKRSLKYVLGGIGILAVISILHFAFISYPLADNGLVRGYYGDSFVSSSLTSLAAQGRYWLSMLLGIFNIPAYDHPLVESPTIMAIFGALTVVGTLWALIFLVRKFRTPVAKKSGFAITGMAFGLAWFLLAFVPVSNLFLQIGTVYADRYAYVPSIGLLVALVCGGAWLLGRFKRSRGMIAGAVALVVLAIAWNGYRVIQVRGAWQDSTTLWASVLEYQPDNHLAIFNAGVSAQELAMREVDAEKRAAFFAAAKARYQEALEHPAFTFRYDFARAHLALGELAFSELDGHIASIRAQEEALEAFDERYKDLDSNEDRESRRAEIVAAMNVAEAARDAAIEEANHQALAAKALIETPWRTERDARKIAARVHDLQGRVSFVMPHEGAKEEARQHFESAKELEEPSTPSVSHLNLANTIASEAQEILEKRGYDEKTLAKVKPMFLQALTEVEEYISRNHLPTARALITRATIKLHLGEAIEGRNRLTPPEEAAFYYRSAAADFQEAVSYIKAKRFHRDKELHDTLIKLAEALQRLPKQEEAALAVVRRAQEADERQPISHLFEARLLMRLGRGQEAIDVLRYMLSADGFPSYLPARIEFASLVIASASSKRDVLIAEWTENRRAEYKREGLDAPEVIPGDQIIAAYLARDEFSKKYRPILDEARLAAQQLLSLKEVETNAQARELRKAGADFLVQAGSALYRTNHMAEAGAVLFEAFSLDETVKGAEELLAVIYLAGAEEASKQRRAALVIGEDKKAEAFETDYWANVTNLLVLSKAARSKLARTLYRKANAERFSIDEAFFYEEQVPVGELSRYNSSSNGMRQVLRPGKFLGDYVGQMSAVIENYQTANLLDSEFPDPLTQLVDYYEKTKEYDKAVGTFRKLADSLTDVNQIKHRNVVLETLGLHLIRWGTSLVGQFRAVASANPQLAQEKRALAVEKYLEAWKVFQELIKAERLRPNGPSRNILSSAGVVAQELAKLTHPDEWLWYSRALEIYREMPRYFEVELIAVLQQLAIFTEPRDEKLAYLNQALAVAKTAQVLEREKQTTAIEESIKWLNNRSEFEKADEAYKKQQYTLALTYLDQAALRYPSANELRGKIFEKLEQYDKAADAYHAARVIDAAAVRAGELLMQRASEEALIDAVLDFRQAQQSLEWRSAEAKAKKQDASTFDALLARIYAAYDQLDTTASAMAKRARDNTEGLSAAQRISFLQTAARISRSPIFALLDLAKYRDSLARPALEFWRAARDNADEDPKLVASFERVALQYANNTWLDYQEVVRRGAPMASRTLLSAASFGLEVMLDLREDLTDKISILETAITMLTKQEVEITSALAASSGPEKTAFRDSVASLGKRGKELKALAEKQLAVNLQKQREAEAKKDAKALADAAAKKQREAPSKSE